MKIFGLRICFIIIFVSFTCVNIFSQEVGNERVDQEEENYDLYLNLFEVSFSYQIPMETFRDNLSGTSFGFRFAYYNNFSNKDNLFWSLHHQSFRISKLSNTFTVSDQFAEYLLDSKTITNVIFSGFGIRHYFEVYTPKLEPFLDVKLGLNSVYTYSSNRVDGSEEAEINFDNFNLSLAYAVGLGFQYNVRKGQALHLMANYASSNNSTYYIVERQGFELPWDNFVKRTTQLDYLQFYFGITFGF